MSELERFRTEIRTWLEQNAPAVEGALAVISHAFQAVALR